MISYMTLHPLEKPPSGIGKGGGGKAASKASSEKVYEIKREIVGTKDKRGNLKIGMKGESKGFKAVYESPPGTRFTVSYTFGAGSLYEIGMRGGRTKTVQLIGEDGYHRGRSQTIRNVSSVKKLFKNARQITIHSV